MLNRIIHPDIEPGVIDNALLTDAIIQQGPKKEAGRLFAEQGVDFQKVTTIRLEFKRILRIDHLWVMPALTKLSLAHNLIEKIQNLDELVNLIELDLSFNKIEKIQNLDKLIKIEVLSLFNNKITCLENLDALENLLIFSIGENLIEDLKEVEYLRRFKNLRTLSFRGNPCLNSQWAQAFLYAVLPHLTYLDYKRLTEEQKEEGLSKHRGRLRLLAEADEAAEKIKEEEERNRKIVEHYTELFVEGLQGYEAFDNLFRGSEIEAWSNEHNDFKYCFDGYREQYHDIMSKLIDFAEKTHISREREVVCYYKVMEEALNESVQKSQNDIAEYRLEKKPLYDTLSQYISEVDAKTLTMEDAEKNLMDLIDLFYDMIHKLWRKLMEQEMTLFESSQLTRSQLTEYLSGLADDLSDTAKETFRKWREADDEWNNEMLQTITDCIDNNKLGFLSDENLEVLRDSELLRAKMSAHQEIRRDFMEERVLLIIRRAGEWSEERIVKANEEELKRNRERIVEINYFLDNERDEWSERQGQLTEKPDALTAAILGDELVL